MNHRFSRFVIVAALLGVMTAGCTQRAPYMAAGPYSIVTKADRTGLRFQPHHEFWYHETLNAPGELLGICGSPRFITNDLGHPSDPSCFALATDGSAIVYLHRPTLAGADPVAQAKPEGLYRHSATRGGQRLLSGDEIGQVWTSRPIPPEAMRVSHGGAITLPTGERCLQYLVITAHDERSRETNCDP